MADDPCQWSQDQLSGLGNYHGAASTALADADDRLDAAKSVVQTDQGRLNDAQASVNYRGDQHRYGGATARLQQRVVQIIAPHNHGGGWHAGTLDSDARPQPDA